MRELKEEMEYLIDRAKYYNEPLTVDKIAPILESLPHEDSIYDESDLQDAEDNGFERGREFENKLKTLKTNAEGLIWS